MFKEPRNRFRGIHFARLGIYSWAPEKAYKYGLSTEPKFDNWFHCRLFVMVSTSCIFYPKFFFQVEARTLGWVALGLSHTKSIKGADLTIGWVSAAGQATLQDYHSVDGRTVRLDPSQDAELIVGFEDENTTVLRFRRKVDTCDTDNDVKITNDTFRVIWAYGEADPPDGAIDWTKVERSGVRLLHLYQGDRLTMSEVNVKQWLVTSNQMTLPQKVGIVE
jgi:hypothetical protein